MAATNDMYVDSGRGEKWCNAVDEITKRVEDIMKGIRSANMEKGIMGRQSAIGR